MCWNTAVDDCLFCRIVAGELPSTRVHEDERAIAIMDINPATRGHVLVIPRAHATTSTTFRRRPGAGALVSSASPAGPCAGWARTASRSCRRNGAAAWQTVFHYHVHVIPRYHGDPLVLPWRPAPGRSGGAPRYKPAYFTISVSSVQCGP